MKEEVIKTKLLNELKDFIRLQSVFNPDDKIYQNLITRVSIKAENYFKNKEFIAMLYAFCSFFDEDKVDGLIKIISWEYFTGIVTGIKVRHEHALAEIESREKIKEH